VLTWSTVDGGDCGLLLVRAGVVVVQALLDRPWTRRCDREAYYIAHGCQLAIEVVSGVCC